MFGLNSLHLTLVKLALRALDGKKNFNIIKSLLRGKFKVFSVLVFFVSNEPVFVSYDIIQGLSKISSVYHN